MLLVNCGAIAATQQDIEQWETTLEAHGVSPDERGVVDYLQWLQPTPERRKQVEDWIRQLGNEDFQARETASTMLRRCGLRERAAIEQATRATDPEVRQRAAEILDAFADPEGPRLLHSAFCLGVERKFLQSPDLLIPIVEFGQGPIRKEAVAAIGNMRAQGWAAIPFLVRLIADEELNDAAESALKQIGPPDQKSVVPLVVCLLDKDKRVAGAAIEALEQTNPAIEEAVPGLIDALGSSIPRVREFAAEALGRTGPPAVKAFQALSDAIWDPDGEVAVVAIWAVVDLEPPAKDLIPVLKRALLHGDCRVPDAAAAALGDMGPAAREAAQDLVVATVSGKVSLGYGAATIHAVDHGGEIAVPLLIPYLQHRDAKARSKAAYVLGGIGPPAKSAVRPLYDMLEEAWDKHAALALGRIGPAAKEAVPLLRRYADSKAPRIQAKAMLSLALIAPADHMDGLAGILNRGGDAAEAALYDIYELGPEGKPLVPALMLSLDKGGSYFEIERNVAMFALSSIGPPAQKAVPKLVALLDDEAETVRLNAAHALSRIVPTDEASLAVLRERIRSPDVNPWLVLTLWRADRQFAAAAPKLAELLGHSDWKIREEAAKALEQMGPAAREALPALRRACTDKSRMVRRISRRLVTTL